MTSQSMTVQALLREARQLSLKEQIQLATQLLQSVDQQLEKPVTVGRLSARNPAENSALDSPVATDAAIVDDPNQESSISYLLEHPIPVRRFKPLNRDEIYDRC